MTLYKNYIIDLWLTNPVCPRRRWLPTTDRSSSGPSLTLPDRWAAGDRSQLLRRKSGDAKGRRRRCRRHCRSSRQVRWRTSTTSWWSSLSRLPKALLHPIKISKIPWENWQDPRYWFLLDWIRYLSDCSNILHVLRTIYSREMAASLPIWKRHFSKDLCFRAWHIPWWWICRCQWPSGMHQTSRTASSSWRRRRRWRWTTSRWINRRTSDWPSEKFDKVLLLLIEN